MSVCICVCERSERKGKCMYVCMWAYDMQLKVRKECTKDQDLTNEQRDIIDIPKYYFVHEDEQQWTLQQGRLTFEIIGLFVAEVLQNVLFALHQRHLEEKQLKNFLLSPNGVEVHVLY